METRANTSSTVPHSGRLAAFTMVELMVVMAIMAMVLAALLPAMGSFLNTSRLPNARTLISTTLRAARNYAVANNLTTAVVLVENDSGTTRRTLMFMAESSDRQTFTAVAGWEPTYLPDHVLASDDNVVDWNERPVVVCFLPMGQLSSISGISQIADPYENPVQNLPSESATRFYLYDDQSAGNIQELLINYYTGELIE